MEPTGSLHMGRARWMLTGALLLLTLIAALAALVELPPTYQAESSVVLLASQASSKPFGGNPYLNFSPSLTLTADAVSRELMSPDIATHLADNGFPDSYSVALANYTTDTTGSVLIVTITGTDKSGVDLTMHGVTNEISTVLTGLQSASPTYDRIQAVTLSMNAAALNLGQLARLLTVLIGVGLVVSFGIPWIVETRITGRRLQRAAWSATPPHPADPVGGERRTTPQHAAPGDTHY
jgi:hypothetical protein